MKKYFGIICAILLVFSLSSCGVKKELDELDLEGRKISATAAKDFIEDWEQYKLDRQKEDLIFENWYSVEMNTIQKTSSSDGNSEMYMSVSGKVYESYYTFKTKMNLTLKIEGSAYDNESSSETEYKGTVKIIYIDGKAYFDVSMTTKVTGTYEKSTAKVDELIVGDFSDLGEIIGMGEDMSAGYDAINQFALSLSAIVNESTEYKAYREEDVYSYEYKSSTDSEYTSGRTSSLSQMSMTMDEEYNVKKFETYGSYYSNGEEYTSETYYSTSWKKSLGALIIKPLNHKKYIVGDFEDILEDMMGGIL